MKTKTAKMLPKTASEIINGGLYLQRVRCGKQNCKCTRGETHPAYYFITRRAGKIVKIYVRRAEIEEFAGIVSKANADRKLHRQTSKSNFELLKQFRQILREKTLPVNSLKGGSNL